MEERTEYQLNIIVNGKKLTRVVIDQHYQENHPDMNDELILELVKTINNGNFPIEDEKDGFQYFTVEPVKYQNKPYRLVLLIYLHDEFLGVVNAFRIRRK